MIAYDVLDTDLGRIYIAVNEAGLCKVAVSGEDWEQYLSQRQWVFSPAKCVEVSGEIKEYLAGRRRYFSIPLSLEGTLFNRKVWDELLRIPYGEIRTYTDIAVAVGHPRACRAVGQANYHNPLPIVIPCHRVLGKNGKLMGYKGTHTQIKAHLLRLEGVKTV